MCRVAVSIQSACRCCNVRRRCLCLRCCQAGSPRAGWRRPLSLLPVSDGHGGTPGTPSKWEGRVRRYWIRALCRCNEPRGTPRLWIIKFRAARARLSEEPWAPGEWHGVTGQDRQSTACRRGTVGGKGKRRCVGRRLRVSSHPSSGFLSGCRRSCRWTGNSDESAAGIVRSSTYFGSH